MDEAVLRRVLEQALPEGQGAMEKSPAVLSLPLPNGQIARFRIVDSPVLAPELAAQYPQIKSYRGQGVDNPSLTLRCSWTPSGFSALMSDGVQAVMIQPLAWFRQGPPQRDGSNQVSPNGSTTNNAGSGEVQYVSYYGKDYTRGAEEAMCLVEGDQPSALKQRRAERHAQLLATPSTEFVTLRKYKILIATTYEYTAAHGGTTTSVVSSLNARMNDVNFYFQKELAIQLLLVTDNSLLYTTSSDPFTNGNLTEMLKEARRTLKTPGLPAHDLGHMLGYVANAGNSGNAYIGVAGETLADSEGFFKDAGVTVLGSTVVDQQATIALMHEISHQFGATHTFNGTAGNCGITNNGRTGETAFEPGSGQTIMSLGGACGGDNVVSLRSPFFHSGSLEQIREYVDSFGSSVGMATTTTNQPPTVNAGMDYVIPKRTPFALMGTVSDPDSQPLTWTWEQIDGGATDFANGPYTDAGDIDLTKPVTTRPLFRWLTPATASGSMVTQTFPDLQYTLNNVNVPPLVVGGLQTAQRLPAVTRTMNFRLTARDNQGSGGGFASGTVHVGVDGNAGPFRVTEPNGGEIWANNSSKTVRWNAVNTGAGTAVNCANVKISYSTDGGNNFSTLLASTPNTGSATIATPNIHTTQVRIKIEAIGNVFFDISDGNFSILNNTPSCSYSLSSNSTSVSAAASTGSFTVFATSGCSWTAGSSVPWLTITSGASGTGNGTVNYSVAANDGIARVGGITAGGKSFAVIQAEASGSGLLFYPLAKPLRVLDTRPGDGQSLCDQVNVPITGGTALATQARMTCDGITIPENAQAIVGNLSVVNPPTTGQLTIYPSNWPVPRDANNQLTPGVSNMAYIQGDILSNAFTTALSAEGEFSVYSSQTAHVVVDVSGYYAPPGAGGLYYHPLSRPLRLLDTRAGEGNCDNIGAMIQAGTSLTTQARITCEGLTIPAGAQAIVGNASALDGSGVIGYMTIYPAGSTAPLAANMVYPGYLGFPGEIQTILSNYFIVGLNANGQFNIFAERTIDMVIDVAGYYSAEVSDVNGQGMKFNPLPRPLRIMDTQPNSGCDNVSTPINAGTSLNVPARLACEFITIPTVAKAVAGNVTVINQDTGSAGYMTLYPEGQAAPLVANITYWPKKTLPNGTILGLLANGFFVGLNDGNGQFSVFAERNLHVIVDVAGYFAP
ncbi:MAG: reprolysin-like metallopeptidase [Acidobacteriota bacterium]